MCYPVADKHKQQYIKSTKLHVAFTLLQYFYEDLFTFYEVFKPLSNNFLIWKYDWGSYVNAVTSDIYWSHDQL